MASTRRVIRDRQVARIAAIITVGGICFGTIAYRGIQARWFRWDRCGCDMD